MPRSRRSRGSGLASSYFRMFAVTSIVTDPTYLTGQYATTNHFKKLADATGWDPTPCRADADCGAAGTCAGAASGHGYCAPGCATDVDCSDNKICDLNPAVNGCRFECLANADCEGTEMASALQRDLCERRVLLVAERGRRRAAQVAVQHPLRQRTDAHEFEFVDPIRIEDDLCRWLVVSRTLSHDRRLPPNLNADEGKRV